MVMSMHHLLSGEGDRRCEDVLLRVLQRDEGVAILLLSKMVPIHQVRVEGEASRVRLSLKALFSDLIGSRANIALNL